MFKKMKDKVKNSIQSANDTAKNSIQSANDTQEILKKLKNMQSNINSIFNQIKNMEDKQTNNENHYLSIFEKVDNIEFCQNNLGKWSDKINHSLTKMQKHLVSEMDMYHEKLKQAVSSESPYLGQVIGKINALARFDGAKPFNEAEFKKHMKNTTDIHWVAISSLLINLIYALTIIVYLVGIAAN